MGAVHYKIQHNLHHTPETKFDQATGLGLTWAWVSVHEHCMHRAHRFHIVSNAHEGSGTGPNVDFSSFRD